MALDLGFMALLALAAVGLGDRLLGAFAARPGHPSDAWGWSLVLGLGIVGMMVLGLGLVGALTTPGLVGLTLGTVAAGIGPGRRATVALARTVGPGRQSDGGWFGGLMDGVGLATLGATLVTALGPVTDGDALCYHLQVPKVFLLAGRMTFEPDLHETIYPLLTEMLYALALGLRGPVACRLVEWLLGVGFAMIVAALARPTLGDARARWAGTIALLVPAVSVGMAAPLNDVALAAFGNAAILGWTRWRERPSLRGASLAGVALGLALGVKYPALVLGGVLAASFVILGPRDMAIRRRAGHALLFGLVTLAVGGAWYARAGVATGNPVFPFYRQVFGGAGIDEVLDPIKRPMPVTAIRVLTGLGPMTLDPGRFDSFSHQFGPVFLLFLPALLLVWPPAAVGRVVAIGYAFLCLCLTQRQSMRFVLTAVGPLSVGSAWVAGCWVDRAGGAATGRPGVWSRSWRSAWSARRAWRSSGSGRWVGWSWGSSRPPTTSTAASRPSRSGAGSTPTCRPTRGSSARTIEGSTSPPVHDGAGAPPPDRSGRSGRVGRRGREPAPRRGVHPPPPLPARADRRRGVRPDAERPARPVARRPAGDLPRAPGRRRRRRPPLRDLSPRRPKFVGPMPRPLDRPSLADLRGRVQKQHHRTIGNVLARRIGRPLAVYGTWLTVRLGIPAHAVTVLALVSLVGGAVAIGLGTRGGFIAASACSGSGSGSIMSMARWRGGAGPAASMASTWIT